MGLGLGGGGRKRKSRNPTRINLANMMDMEESKAKSALDNQGNFGPLFSICSTFYIYYTYYIVPYTICNNKILLALQI